MTQIEETRKESPVVYAQLELAHDSHWLNLSWSLKAGRKRKRVQREGKEKIIPGQLESRK
jgi:hypothetical protein